MLHQLKTPAVAMAIGLSSVLGACWVEPFIPPHVLDLAVLFILTSLAITFWIYLRNLVMGMLCSALTVYFHFYCGSCFVRQVALAFIIAGCAIALWHGISHRSSKTKRN